MDIQVKFNRINELLEDTDYPMEITDISDLEDFLNDDDNSRFDAYDEIAELYDQIVEGGEDDTEDF